MTNRRMPLSWARVNRVAEHRQDAHEAKCEHAFRLGNGGDRLSADIDCGPLRRRLWLVDDAINADGRRGDVVTAGC